MAAHQLRLTLKKLQSQRYALQQEVQAAQHAGTDPERIQQLQAALREVLRAIEKVEHDANSIVVSEHALLRYFERILGYDLDILSAALLPPETVARIQQLGSSTYPVTVAGQTVRIRVQDRVVTTVLPRKG